MALSTWNSNLGAYENVKLNVLADRMAKNRWGSKFKKLYNPLKNESNEVDFTRGMMSCVDTDVFGVIEELENLRDRLNAFFLLSDGTTAKPNSYFSLLCTSSYDSVYGTSVPMLKDIKLSLSTSLKSTNDQRKVSKFFQKESEGSTAVSYLEPIDSYYNHQESVEESSVIYGKVKSSTETQQKPYYSKNQLSLTVADGTAYGHIKDTYVLAPNTNFNNVFDLYGAEEESELFRDVAYKTEFSELFTDYELEKWLLDFVTYSYSFEEHKPSANASINIVFGADLVLAWLNENLTSWYALLNGLDGNTTANELDLIEHLNLCEVLQEQIGGNASSISSIRFKFEKTVSPPLVEVSNDNPFQDIGYDPNYKWWEEEQFDDIRKAWKNFYVYCYYDSTGYDSADEGGGVVAYVTLKDEAFSLGGFKIYWLVSAFLDIGVRNKKRSFFQRLFTIALLVVGVYLTAVSGNPAWMKVLLITTSILSFSGSLSPKAQLVVAVVTFVYGISSTNFSALSGGQMFQWAMNNIEMVFKMMQTYEAMKIEDNSNDSELTSVVEQQDKVMQFIYTDAYSQYDNLYSVMYDYEPKYK